MNRYSRLNESSLSFLKGMMTPRTLEKLSRIIQDYPELEEDLLELIADITANTLPRKQNESSRYRRMRRLNESVTDELIASGLIIPSGFEIIDGMATYRRNIVFSDDMYEVARSLGYSSLVDEEDYDEDEDLYYDEVEIDVMDFLEERGISITGFPVMPVEEFIKVASQNRWKISDIENFDEMPLPLQARLRKEMR